MKKIFVGSEHHATQNQRGITLIALIITIIVLLILAGVSISLLTGQDSIIGKAKQAKNEYTNASQNEVDTINRLGNILEGGIGEGTVWDLSKISDTVTEEDLSAPIPVGYVKSQISGEDTISGGLVIYDIRMVQMLIGLIIK